MERPSSRFGLTIPISHLPPPLYTICLLRRCFSFDYIILIPPQPHIRHLLQLLALLPYIITDS